MITNRMPYPGMNKKGELIADGIAFSSKNAIHCPTSLKAIYENIDETIYSFQNYSLYDSYDLTKWSKMGILLLNTSLSTIVNKSGVHTLLWKPFINYVINKINKEKNNLGIILIGSNAKKYKTILTNRTFAVYSCEHPAAAFHNGRSWKHENVFKSLDAYQSSINNVTIDW